MAHVDYFLKLEGIEGEATDSKHKNEIQLTSWSWGATQPGSAGRGGGGGAGKVSVQDMHFTKHADKATPKLFQHCATGHHITKAVLVARKAGKDQQEYLKVTLSDCIVSSQQVSGHSEEPQESFSLNASKIEIEYKEQKADGTLGGAVKGGWDISQNKATA
jgi:type VI secretion system secreted protein Hcp